MTKTRITRADRAAAKTVARWVADRRIAAERSVIRDVDVRLVPIEYQARPGWAPAGTKVMIVRDGTVIAWFDSNLAARRAIDAAGAH